MLSKRAYLSSLALIILVGISSWFSVHDNTDLPEPEQIYIRSKAKQINIAQMSLEGKLKYTSHAESAEQYSNGPTKLLHPSLDLYDPKSGLKQPWIIQSDEAIVIDSHQKISLTGHVKISREKTESTPAIQLSTEHLIVYPDHNYAETDDPVTIEIPHTGTHMHAVGMKAYLNPERLEMLSRIRSIYDQPR